MNANGNARPLEGSLYFNLIIAVFVIFFIFYKEDI